MRRLEARTRRGDPPTRRDALIWSALGAAICAWPRVVRAKVVSRTSQALYATDPVSGLALRGFDPVSYFLPGATLPEGGRAGIEWDAEGVHWRFANRANREAFREAPAVYRPRLYGFDPVSAANGALTPGDPLIFTLVEGWLYLFRSAEKRDEAGRDVIAKAEERLATLLAEPE